MNAVVAEESGVRMDVTRFPIVVVTPPETVSDEEMRAYMDEYAAMEATAAGPFALILDLRWCKKITPTQRKMLTDSMKTRAEDTPCQGVAMIFDSRLLRGILTAMFWVTKPAYPTRVFADPEGAEPWVRGLVDEATARERNDGTAANEPSGMWMVQAPASLSRDKARDLVHRMCDIGYEAVMVEAQTAGRNVFVPRAGPFADRRQAIDARDAFQAAEIEAVVLQVGDDPSEP